jgi:hypothetical protein
VAAGRLHEAHRAAGDLGLGLDERVLHGREGDLAAAQLQPCDADAAAARVAVAGDLVAVDLDPGLQLVRLAEEVVLVQHVEVDEPVVRRLVVVGDAHVEGQPVEALDGAEGDPRDGRDRGRQAHGTVPSSDSVRAAGQPPIGTGDSASWCPDQPRPGCAGRLAGPMGGFG